MREHTSVDGPVCPYCDYVAEPQLLHYQNVECPMCDRAYRVDTEITWYTEWVNEPKVQNEDSEN